VKAGCDRGLYDELSAPFGFEGTFLNNTCGAPDFNRLFQCWLHTGQTISDQKNKQNRIPITNPQEAS